MYNQNITDMLINHFGTERTLCEVRDDYEDLELMIDRERAASPDGSRRLAALKVLARLQLNLILEKLVETPDIGGESTFPTK